MQVLCSLDVRQLVVNEHPVVEFNNAINSTKSTYEVLELCGRTETGTETAVFLKPETETGTDFSKVGFSVFFGPQLAPGLTILE